MAAKKKNKRAKKIEKTKAILKRINNDFIDATFAALEKKGNKKNKWKKLAKKIAKKTKPLQEEQVAFAKETAKMVQKHFKKTNAHLKELTNESETLEDLKKAITENPIADKAEEIKHKIKNKIAEAKHKKQKSKKKATQKETSAKKKETKTNSKKDNTKAEATTVKDDLKILKGIGPVLEKSLNKLGVSTYAQIAEMPLKDLKELLVKGEINPNRFDLSGWKTQAKLALKDATDR